MEFNGVELDIDLERMTMFELKMICINKWTNEMIFTAWIKSDYMAFFLSVRYASRDTLMHYILNE